MGCGAWDVAVPSITIIIITIPSAGYLQHEEQQRRW